MGVTVMAYLTAIITTALTSGSVTGHAMIVNTEVSKMVRCPLSSHGSKNDTWINRRSTSISI